jgi:membrane fusion protein (multidrug efflux system)
LAQEQQAVLRSKQALLYAAATHRRRETALTKFGWGTGERMDNAIAADISADAAVDQAYAAIKSEEAQVGVLNAEDQTLSAREAAARSEVSLNQSYLDRSEVRSPTGGKLGQVLVKIGEFVKPGDVLLQLVPTGNRYVIANFKETQISKMAVGQEVTVTLDAFPGERFAGKIASFSPATGSKFAALPIDNANGNFLKIVQRRRVRIELKDFPNSDTRLLPGLSARVQVHVG